MESSKERIEAQICAYVDGELHGEELEEIERHLANNPQHRALIQELMQHKALLQGLPRARVPGDLNEGLTGQLERHSLLGDDAEQTARRSIFRLHRWPQFASIAAVIMLATGLAIVVYYVMPPGGRQQAGNSFAIKESGKSTTTPLAEREVLADGTRTWAKGGEGESGLPRLQSKLANEMDADANTSAGLDALAKKEVAEARMKEGQVQQEQLGAKVDAAAGAGAAPGGAGYGSFGGGAAGARGFRDQVARGGAPGGVAAGAGGGIEHSLYKRHLDAYDRFETVTGPEIRQRLEQQVAANAEAGAEGAEAKDLKLRATVTQGNAPVNPAVLCMVVSTSSPDSVNVQLGDYLRDNGITYAYSEVPDVSRVLKVQERGQILGRAPVPAPAPVSADPTAAVTLKDEVESAKSAETAEPLRPAQRQTLAEKQAPSRAVRAKEESLADSQQQAQNEKNKSAAGRTGAAAEAEGRTLAQAEQRNQAQATSEFGTASARPSQPSQDPAKRSADIRAADTRATFGEQREQALSLGVTPSSLGAVRGIDTHADRPAVPAGSGVILARMSRRQLSELGMKLNIERTAEKTELREGAQVALEGLTFKLPVVTAAAPQSRPPADGGVTTFDFQGQTSDQARQMSELSRAAAPTPAPGPAPALTRPAPSGQVEESLSRQDGARAAAPAGPAERFRAENESAGVEVKPATRPTVALGKANLATTSPSTVDESQRERGRAAPGSVVRGDVAQRDAGSRPLDREAADKDVRLNYQFGQERTGAAPLAVNDPMDQPVEVLIVVQSAASLTAPTAPAMPPAAAGAQPPAAKPAHSESATSPAQAPDAAQPNPATETKK